MRANLTIHHAKVANAIKEAREVTLGGSNLVAHALHHTWTLQASSMALHRAVVFVIRTMAAKVITVGRRRKTVHMRHLTVKAITVIAQTGVAQTTSARIHSRNQVTTRVNASHIMETMENGVTQGRKTMLLQKLVAHRTMAPPPVGVAQVLDAQLMA